MQGVELFQQLYFSILTTQGISKQEWMWKKWLLKKTYRRFHAEILSPTYVDIYMENGLSHKKKKCVDTGKLTYNFPIDTYVTLYNCKILTFPFREDASDLTMKHPYLCHCIFSRLFPRYPSAFALDICFLNFTIDRRTTLYQTYLASSSDSSYLRSYFCKYLFFSSPHPG